MPTKFSRGDATGSVPLMAYEIQDSSIEHSARDTATRSTAKIALGDAPALTFVRGHHIGAYYEEFPHTCPGEGCAIARWTLHKSVVNKQERERRWQSSYRVQKRKLDEVAGSAT